CASSGRASRASPMRRPTRQRTGSSARWSLRWRRCPTVSVRDLMGGFRIMARTAQFDLPLVLPAQAQKHVTVNEAFARLDAVAQLRLVSSVLVAPPGEADEGAAYLLPAGAGGAWEGQSGRIAVRSNGGWIFVTPRDGWRAWDVGAQAYRTCYGAGWVANAVAVSPGGAGTQMRV